MQLALARPHGQSSDSHLVAHHDLRDEKGHICNFIRLLGGTYQFIPSFDMAADCGIMPLLES